MQLLIDGPIQFFRLGDESVPLTRAQSDALTGAIITHSPASIDVGTAGLTRVIELMWEGMTGIVHLVYETDGVIDMGECYLIRYGTACGPAAEARMQAAALADKVVTIIGQGRGHTGRVAA